MKTNKKRYQSNIIVSFSLIYCRITIYTVNVETFAQYIFSRISLHENIYVHSMY